MTLVVTHPFVSPKPQGGDSTRVYGPQWNANHTIAGTADGTQLNANVVQAVVNDTNIQGSIASQTLTFSWGGTLAAARLNANVVQAITNDTNVTGTISAQNLTLGWTGQLGLVRGGTNADLSATGGTHQVLKQSGVGSAVTVGQLAFTDISGTASAAQLPNPTASTLGGIESYAAVSHQWINTISTSGVPSSTQPAIADISGWGTGVATAVGVNIGSAGAPVLFNGAGGTPSSLTLTNATGLPLTGLANQAAWTFLFNNTSSSAAPTANTIDGLTVKATPAAGDELILWDVAGTAVKKATVSSIAAAAGVSSIAGNTGAFTLNSTSGITNSTNDIILSQASSSQFGAVKVDNSTIKATAGVISTTNPLPAPITASLGADVAMNNTANYFDGPSIAQGTSGTWWVSGTVTVLDTTGAADFDAKLWDGTTVIASARSSAFGALQPTAITLSGFLANPAGNIKISCRDENTTTGIIKFNTSGNSKDSTISAHRIA